MSGDVSQTRRITALVGARWTKSRPTRTKLRPNYVRNAASCADPDECVVLPRGVTPLVLVTNGGHGPD